MWWKEEPTAGTRSSSKPKAQKITTHEEMLSKMTSKAIFWARTFSSRFQYPSGMLMAATETMPADISSFPAPKGVSSDRDARQSSWKSGKSSMAQDSPAMSTKK